MFFRRKVSNGRTYVQIVDNQRNGGESRQRVVATLGRLDRLQESGQMERLLASGARFAAKAMVVTAVEDGTIDKVEVKRIGPALVFERLWRESRCRKVIEELAGGRKFEFEIERAIFLTVLHRLFGGGSDRSADRWREDYWIEGVEALQLHHLYRAMAWLGEELPTAGQQDRLPFAPRCTKDLVEEHLLQERRDLFTQLDLVFMDTTSLYFEGAGGQTIGRHGFSKDHRPDLRQLVLAIVLDGDGRPVCTEIWPGNTADVSTLIPVIDRLRSRFGIGRVCVVADRGFISAETIAGLEARGLLYILGARERSDAMVRDVVLADTGPFVPLCIEKRGKEAVYGAKEVKVAGRRYIVCRNESQAIKDAADRKRIVETLRQQLDRGDKSLVGNGGYRRYIKTVGQRFTIDPQRVEQDALFDGIFVLRTNTDLSPLRAMMQYKQLWKIEQVNRTAKHLFATRPIFHKVDETIRGHVFCSFLALVLQRELEERIAAMRTTASWPEILADLASLTTTQLEQQGKRFNVRSAPRPAAMVAVRAVGVALPPTVQEMP